MVSIFFRGAGSNRVCLLPKKTGCVELVELLKLVLELLGHFGCLQAQAYSLCSKVAVKQDNLECCIARDQEF